MRKWKNVMAVAITATMVMGSITPVFADEGESSTAASGESGSAAASATAVEGSDTGAGKVEGTVSTDVFNVVVPTSAANVFNFVLDPEGLIQKTGEAAHGGQNLYQDDATVFFENTVNGGTNTFSNVSDSITMTNKGTQIAKVTIKAEVDSDTITGVTMADNASFTDETASLYLALVDETDAETAIKTSEITVSGVLSAAPQEAYEYSYDTSTQKYKYTLKSELTGIEFDEYSFKLTGACNSAGDWSSLSELTPSVAVTWKVEAYAPTGTAASFTAGTNVGEITYTDGTDDMKISEILSVKMTNEGGPFDGFAAFEGAWAAAAHDTSGRKITLSADFVKFFNAETTKKCDAVVTYKTELGQVKTVTVKDVKTAN